MATKSDERRVSEDGLWLWGGKSWLHVERVELGCSRCSLKVEVGSGKSSFKCPASHSQDLVACKQCRGTFQRPTEYRQYDTRCPWCGYSSLYVTNVSAWEWASEQRGRGLWPGSTVPLDVDQRALRNFTLAAGGGTAIPNGSRCSIDFTSDGLTVTPDIGIMERVPYEEVEHLQISGSTTRNGGGLIGGGFGLLGAAEGILAASVINSLATTSIYSVVRIACKRSEYVFVSYTVDSASLGMMLTPVQLRIREARQSAPPVQAASSIADELVKLAQLRDTGVLSDAEFGAAKARLLA